MFHHSFGPSTDNIQTLGHLLQCHLAALSSLLFLATLLIMMASLPLSSTKPQNGYPWHPASPTQTLLKEPYLYYMLIEMKQKWSLN